jgi:hypothetical protein
MKSSSQSLLLEIVRQIEQLIVLYISYRRHSVDRGVWAKGFILNLRVEQMCFTKGKVCSKSLVID